MQPSLHVIPKYSVNFVSQTVSFICKTHADSIKLRQLLVCDEVSVETTQVQNKTFYVVLLTTHKALHFIDDYEITRVLDSYFYDMMETIENSIVNAYCCYVYLTDADGNVDQRENEELCLEAIAA